MHPDLQRYIDGELPRDALPVELRAEADAWDRLTDAALDLHGESAPGDLAARVMHALPPAPRRHAWSEPLEWLLRPREMRIRPVYGLLAVATVAGLLVLPRALPAPPELSSATGQLTEADHEDGRAPAGAADEPIVYVRFAFRAPSARSVALAGDFNDWLPDALPLNDADGDGVWTGTFALQPGVHKYMFVIDGERWETDPGAERHLDDGFGMRNALIAITPPVRRTI